MIPTIEEIIQDLLSGGITAELAVNWLNQHAEGSQYSLNEQRSYFSGLAMQGIVSSITSGDSYYRLKQVAQDCNLTLSQWIAKDSIKQADAMLAELNKH